MPKAHASSTCIIWCDRAKYHVEHTVAEVVRVLSTALMPGTNQAPLLYFSTVGNGDFVAINATKVSSIENYYAS